VGLERCPLSLVSTIEELLERKSSGSGLETEITAVGILSRRPRGTHCPQQLALTSPTSDGCSVGIVHSRTHATEFSFYLRSYASETEDVKLLIFSSRTFFLPICCLLIQEDGNNCIIMFFF
jgi:hypothetical protein